MKTIILAALFCLSSLSLLAQNSGYSIKGVVADTTLKTKLARASVTILNSKDSILVKFSRTAADGTFSMNLAKGKFILLIAYPEYADYVAPFELDSLKRILDFSQINLKLKSQLLAEVVINGTAAITIKGDTTVFSTSKLVVQPNAKVEDLLKQLPGIEIDQNGKITAQGQAVQKVLVDGEEFFGDDPTLVTRNIRGDMVKEFQLYDKKSDQAAFTGIDDGVKNKTLNVVLKDNSKNGYFGKVDAGETPATYYQGQGMFNNFRAKKKIAAYGTIGNTGKTGLSFQDASKYGTGNNVQILDGGVIALGGSNDELESFNGNYDGHGIPAARTGGAHFDSKWNKDKESINANYKIGSLSVVGTQNMIKQNNLPGQSVINSSADQNYNNDVFRQRLDMTYEVKVSPTSTLKFSVDGSLKNSETRNNNLGSYKRSDSTLVNQSDRVLSNNSDQRMVNITALWTKRFKKAGRTLSLNISESASSANAKGFLNTTNSFYNTQEILDSIKHIDQQKTSTNRSSILGANMTWSEPLSKTFSVILNYGIGLRNESAERISFNKSQVTNKYDSLDQQYSSNFDLANISNQAGAMFNYSKKKTVFNFGTRISVVSFNQTDLANQIKYKMDYLVWAPQARYTYRFSQQKSLSVNYSGFTNQPSINQIQPVRVNDDPLNITLGNADLRPPFRNSLNVSFNSFKVLTSRSIFGSTSYSITSNPFATSRTFDPVSGISTSRTVNADKPNSVFTFFASTGWKLKKSGMNLGINVSTDASHYQDVVNGTFYRSRYSSYFIGPSVSNTKLKKYTFRFSAGPRYKTTVSTLNLDDNNWTVSSSGALTIYLPGKVEISSDANYAYTERTSSFNQVNNPLIWNANVSKRFFKKENLKFTLSGNDLLNQNIGYVRNAFQQTTYNTIQRYFMGSLTWDFTKPAPVAEKK